MSQILRSAQDDRGVLCQIRSVGVRRGAWLDVALALVLVTLALPARIVNLDLLAAKPDEGIRLEQLFLMSIGFRPIRDIFASQGPLSLDATYPLFALLGGTLAAARLAVGLYSLAELMACWLLARLAGGPLAAGLAGLLLLLSPGFLKNSRTALVEVPALLPATLAIIAALRFKRTGRVAWLVGTSVLFALAVLIKPLVLPAGLPVLMLLVARRRGRARNLASFALLAGLIFVLVALIYGPSELYDQVVRYRVGSARAEGWSLATNLDQLGGELVWESAGGVALVVAAVPLSLLIDWRRALPLVAWLAASAGLLLVYSPLQPKHAVILLPPAAILAGLALAGALRPGRSSVPGLPRVQLGSRALDSAALCALALLIWYGLSTPGLLGRQRQVVRFADAAPEAASAVEARNDSYSDDVALLASLTGPNDFILVDEPYLAYLSRRRVPPQLVDPTSYRLRSGTLSASEVINSAQSFDVRAMLLWTDGLRDLKRFGEWVDQSYRPVKIYERRNGKDRALYLRNDADLPAARRVVETDLTIQPQTDFAGLLRLVAASLDQTEARPTAQIGISSEWEALMPMEVDYRVLAILNDSAGHPVTQIERSLGGGSVGTASWEPGRWTVRTSLLTVPPRTPPGTYSLAIAIYDSKARQRLPVQTAGVGSSTGSERGQAAADEAAVGTIRVR